MHDPLISDLFQSSRVPLLSFEFFPPKDDAGIENLRKAAEQLLAVKPDFVTCTYGAGGSTRQKTLQVCQILRDIGFAPVMPHLTCVGSSRTDLAAIIDDFASRGVRNIMTLRGDPPKGDTTFRPAPDGLAYAAELVDFIMKRRADMCCGVACYPEVHPEAVSADADLDNLKRKLDLGGAFGTTQLFFDNEVYFRFLDRCEAAGITKPILPGLLPAISLKQVQRMCTMCKASLPVGLVRDLEAAGGEGEEAEEAGIQWAAKQIDELLDRGAPGVHLYVLNRARAARSADLIALLQKHRGA